MVEKNQIIEELLKKECYVIDVLPKQVPANSNGIFFEIEDYLLNNVKRYRFQD